MNGIALGSGINDCLWNINGKCTSFKVTRAERKPAYSRDWDSRQNCTVTQLGVHCCNEYLPEGK
jgi:hypothetical protein